MQDKTVETKADPIRAGLIGYGYVGKTFHAPLIAATEGWHLAGIASSDPAKVAADFRDVPVETDPQRLIARTDLDVVVIATPNAQHRPLAEAALAAGRHVVVDKPFTLTLKDARAVLSAAEAAGRHCAVFQNRRWDSDFLGVRQAVRDGAIGKLRHVESHIDRFRPTVRARWREQAGPGSGIWFDLGPHLVDQALQVLGLPERVQANFAAQREGAEVEDWAHVILDYGRTRAILHAGMLAAGGVSRFLLHGDAGSLRKQDPDIQEAQLRAGMVPGAPGWGKDADEMQVFAGDGALRTLPAPPGDYRQFYALFGKALRGEAETPVPAHEALAVMAVLDAAAESARTRTATDLPLTEAERAAWR